MLQLLLLRMRHAKSGQQQNRSLISTRIANQKGTMTGYGERLVIEPFSRANDFSATARKKSIAQLLIRRVFDLRGAIVKNCDGNKDNRQGVRVISYRRLISVLAAIVGIACFRSLMFGKKMGKGSEETSRGRSTSAEVPRNRGMRTERHNTDRSRGSR